jgi:hypothetical protein
VIPELDKLALLAVRGDVNITADETVRELEKAARLALKRKVEGLPVKGVPLLIIMLEPLHERFRRLYVTLRKVHTA